jgi:predicted ArsR family transcriptional regulator
MRELVAETGLHENSLRRSLGRLVARGAVRVEPERRTSRGRPALRYRRPAAVEEPFGRFLPLLLELLDRAPASADAAYEIGRAHGAASAATHAGRAPQAVAFLLDALGFAPRPAPASPGGDAGLMLDRCPFSDAVTSSRQGGTVCALHHGLVAGVAAANGGELERFVVHDPRQRPCEVTVR